MHEAYASIEKLMLEHVSSTLVEQLKKIKEDMQLEA